MKLDDNILNQLFDLSRNFVDNELKDYNYSSDITHLLYIIIPAFIIKYGFDNKNKITKAFKIVPFVEKKNDEKKLQAYYASIPVEVGPQFITKKFIVLNRYLDKPLMELIDNIVHEYNHAVNSINDEIKWDEKNLYVRTGLTFIRYNRHDYKDNSKEDSYILEEIINTKQTEEIIDIINSFNKYNINDSTISTTLYNINNYIKGNYSSEAYLFQSSLCKELMSNNTLISVLSNMRFQGIIDEIPYFFDNVTGIEDSYNKLIKILNESVKLEEEYSKKKFFKRKIIRNVLKLYGEAKEIIDTFNRNYHFK